MAHSQEQKCLDPEASPGETLFKRVLVKLVGGSVPSALAHLQWIKLVDDIYSVNVPTRPGNEARR